MKFACQICVAIACIAVVLSGEASAEAAKVDYLTQVKPLLRERCYACHGALKQEGGLRLDTVALMRQGGDSGAAVDPDDTPEFNLIIERTADTDPGSRMPPEHEGEPLTSAHLDLLKRWIAQGASIPADETPEADPAQHWSFQPVVRPEVPEVENSKWVRNPIDAWIAQGHHTHGVVPQDEVSRVLLLRRLTFDLIGLPPTAAEIAACVDDPSPDWYEKAVDRLLDDPRHGQRWARHWMDNWRYSDWWGLGTQLRNSQRHMWHWRDWIVESLNNDLPYDEMVRLMLAADELAPTDPDKLRATGFLARNYFIFNRNTWLDQTVEHVGKGFLGLTMNCAKCHDHKFDPIDHADYYKMRAFFEPYLVRLDMVPGELNVDNNGIPRVFDAMLDKPTYRFIRGDDSQPDESTVIAPGVPELLEFEKLRIEEVELPPEAWQPALRPWVLDEYLAAARKRLQISETNEQKAAATLEAARSANDEALANAASDQAFVPIHEDFATFDSSRWRFLRGKWAHLPGQVEQTMAGPSRSVLQLIKNAPRDFDVTLRYRLQGGNVHRSVGIGFDAEWIEGSTEHDAADAPQFVYASGIDGGSKLQGTYTDNGDSYYPSNAKQSIPVKLGAEHTLRLQVRGDLINASFNDEPVLAWRTPLIRREGTIQLITYDAITSFSEFTLSALADDVELVEPKEGAPPSPNPVVQAEGAMAAAVAQVAVARADLESVQARADAMRATWSESDDEAVSDAAAVRALAVAAIRAERKHALAVAKADVIANENTLRRAAENKKKAAQTKLNKANEALKKAESLLQAEIKDTDQFTPMAGAKWTATRFLHTGQDDPEVTFPQQSSGRRTALAKWITDRRNPLTARVAANQIWTRHLGQPLVASTFDFGRNGSLPTHPELLDWLASELMDNGWDMKHLHRLIVLSSTYRMGSSTMGREDSLSKDPDNHYWWRRVPIRLESQAVRDAVLACAGTLDESMGGPSILPRDQEKSRRRSLYFFHSNNERNLLLTTFDEASVTECYQREQSIVPQQALALTNSALVLESSQQIAQAIAATPLDDESFIRQAFLVLLGIEVSDGELSDCQAALTAWQKLPEATADSARGNLVWSLINHNDFVTLR